jgi:hypothetical protein
MPNMLLVRIERFAAALTGGVVAATLVVGCAANTSASLGGASETGTASLSPRPVTQAEPAFADNSGGILEPAPADTSFPLTADQVQQMLAKDGASAQWVANSESLVVKSGMYHALDAGNSGSSPSPSDTGTLSYVFSGNTGPCPPASPGGAGTPAITAPVPKVCAGTVVANGSTGEIEDVEVTPT